MLPDLMLSSYALIMLVADHTPLIIVVAEEKIIIIIIIIKTCSLLLFFIQQTRTGSQTNLLLLSLSF